MNITWQKLPKNEPLVFEYQFYKTKIGDVLIISWEQTVVGSAFVNTQKNALEEARKRFPKATFRKKETSVAKAILAYIKAPKRFTGTLKLATNGSPFQMKVWKALQAIPFGKTCYYSDLAKAVKQPTAVRAAASAVAKNPFAIIIPCHRVLPRSGGVGNYHWGSKNKSTLLTWEGLTLAP